MDVVGVPGYGFRVKFRHQFTISLLILLPCGRLAAEDFETVLERAREAAIHHRYVQVIELLTPFNAVNDPETRYITAAEIGRAHFHLGRYHEAHNAFRQAVRLRPDRAETAIYLEATSYLMGEKDQAYAILREILASGARDLYLAMTLPGERSFAVDPVVEAIIAEFAVPLEVDFERARILGLSLGDHREVAIEKLGLEASSTDARTLTATAGPMLIWAFAFDDRQKLVDILLQSENLLRYTPYRLRTDCDLDWRATPAAAIAALGSPNHTSAAGDDGITMSWDRSQHAVILDFGTPRHPRPRSITEGAAMLRSVRLKRHATHPDRMTE
jgi:tetratricopeptide (TPR) repeat protein